MPICQAFFADFQNFLLGAGGRGYQLLSYYSTRFPKNQLVKLHKLRDKILLILPIDFWSKKW
jgi:hypothetical protein